MGTRKKLTMYSKTEMPQKSDQYQSTRKILRLESMKNHQNLSDKYFSYMLIFFKNCMQKHHYSFMHKKVMII